MSRSATYKTNHKNPNISSLARRDFYRKCRMPYVPRIPYVPQAIRNSHSYGPISQKYDEYIELFDESDESDQEKPTKTSKYDLNTIQNTHQNLVDESKAPGKPILHCYSTAAEGRHILNNPVTSKKSAPIKKISFALPDEKRLLDNERMDWKDYYPLEAIYKFMDDLEADFPSICTTASIGHSVEGRNLKILKISNSNASNVAVWMDAGIHAREWIAPAVNTYIANHISRNFETLPESVTNKDWYFLPVVNPDGYHYSHTTNRMWRKNRASHNGQTFGVDLNRNFGVGWGGKGSSNQPANSFYRGPRPFSEPESCAMREVLVNSGIKFQVYITLHSYGQIIIFPYSCTTEMAPDYVTLLEGATVMSKAIYNTNGETYKVGISRDVMYAAAGTSNDFAHGAGIPYCYLIELRSKKHKFKLPKEEIEDTGNEILSSVLALVKFVDTYKYQEKVDQKVDLLLEKNDSFVNTAKSHVKQCASYNRPNYSYIKPSDSLMKSQSSYVRLTHVPGEMYDSIEESTDAEWSDCITHRDKSLFENVTTSEKETGIYKKCNEVNKDSSQNVPLNYDSFTQNPESSNYATDGNESFEDLTEALMQREDSFEAWNNFYKTQNDFHEKRNHLIHTGTMFVAADVQWNIGYVEYHNQKLEKDLRNTHLNMRHPIRGVLSSLCARLKMALTATTTRPRLGVQHYASFSPKAMDWNSYHTLETIYAFLDSLQAEYPYLCSVHVIGKSVEGRDLKVIKISNGEKANPGVWLDGAIHPREWISPAVVTYLANRIVRSFNDMPESVTNKDWYILPVMNPDGYAYTHTHDRMWRKNRARFGELVGVDLNRNFSYGFAEKGEEGSSDDPGSVFYRGPRAFSEPETAAVKRAILDAPNEFKAFLSFHSYGEVIIFPWGYTSDSCPNYVELLEGGTAMAKAIYGTSGHTYKVGSTKDLMYYAAGTSIDWSYAVANIPYSYMIELRSKKHRFLLPKEEIMTTATEVENGVFRLMAFIDQRCTGTQTCACPK